MSSKKNAYSGPVIADIQGIELSEVDKDVLRHPKLGGIIFFSRNYESQEQLAALVRCIREISPSLLLSVDQEGGRVQRFRHEFTRIPPMSVIGRIAEVDPALAQSNAREWGWLMAFELLDAGIDFSYAPVLDVDKTGSSVIGDRAFSSNPAVIAALAKAFIAGMREAGMCATAKHFPGHGGVIEDSHLESPVDNRALDELIERDLIPFRELASEYAAIMTAHIVFPSIDDKPVSFSKKWIEEVLKKQLGFEGVVFSDDLSMKGAATIMDVKDRAKTAILSGCDGVLICNDRAQAERTLEFLEAEQLGSGEKIATMRGVFLSENNIKNEKETNRAAFIRRRDSALRDLKKFDIII